MYENAPLGAHVGACLQSGGALPGHCPTRSLEAANGEKDGKLDDEAAHPDTVACTPLCGP
jgi:hypothetical protein